jgi:hypothetical protein
MQPAKSMHLSLCVMCHAIKRHMQHTAGLGALYAPGPHCVDLDVRATCGEELFINEAAIPAHSARVVRVVVSTLVAPTSSTTTVHSTGRTFQHQLYQ